MSRILKAYVTQFRWLLQHVGTRRLDQGVQSLVKRAQDLSERQHLPLSWGLTRVYEELARQPAFRDASSYPPVSRFFCDAGLGGLARWLRGAGYEAFWDPNIDDDELLRKTRETQSAMLTTDSMLMERRVVRDRHIPSLWLPPTLAISEQLALVFRAFHLERRAPRCMSCGGELRPGDKEALREQIPPRTYKWLDEYFVCARCGKLFWHGTHWQRIVRAMDELGLTTAR